MKRVLNEDIYWLQQNNLENKYVQSKVEALCLNNGIQDYSFGYLFNDFDFYLSIAHNTSEYNIMVDWNSFGIVIFKKSSDKHNYKRLNKRFTGNFCWSKCIKWISNQI